MAELEQTPKPQAPDTPPDKSHHLIDSDLEIMMASGLDDGEILRLAHVKHRVSAGECDDLTPEYKRVMFLKYLYDAGRIES